MGLDRTGLSPGRTQRGKRLIRTDNVSTLAEVEGEIEGCVEEECVFRGGGMHWGRPLSGGE